MTGKGDRWGRDRLGRSAPAFLSANIFALPPPTCTARREAGRRWSAAVVSLKGRPTVGRSFVLRPVPDGESAGCGCLQCLFCGLCACCHPLPAMPTALISSCPRSSSLCPHSFALFARPYSIPCALGSSFRLVSGPAVCKLQDCPVGSCNTGLQWRPVHRFIVDSVSFSC